MSHFSVLVVGPEIDFQMAPYHEFECTGRNDEFVQDVNVTEDASETFVKATSTRLKAPDGSLESYFDAAGNWRPEFSELDPDSPSYDKTRRRGFIPPGYVEVKVPDKELMTFAAWAADYYGLKVVDDRSLIDKKVEHKGGHILVRARDDGTEGAVLEIIDRTNPNKKWDWFEVGGRWNGFFRLKPTGKGELGNISRWDSPKKDMAGRAASALKGDIDFAAMRDEAGANAGALYDKAAAITGGATWRSWEAVLAAHDNDVKKIEAVREEYWAQPGPKALKESKDEDFFLEVNDALAGSREAFVAAARDRACEPYAVVQDRVWTGKGRMGWFGMSDDKVSQADWNKHVNALIDSLPDDTLLSIVDCHI